MLEVRAGSYGVLVLFPLKTATLTSVLEPICFRNHVRLLANRGYSSVTAMYDAAERFSEAWDAGKKPVVIYLGDHDPSGIDITRDIDDRLNLMSNGADPTVERVALDFPRSSFTTCRRTQRRSRTRGRKSTSHATGASRGSWTRLNRE